MLAESQGPHEAGDYSSTKASDEGYHVVYSGGVRLIRDRTRDTAEIRAVGSDQIKASSSLREKFEQYESELLSAVEASEDKENEQGMSEGTKQRLEDLGYM